MTEPKLLNCSVYVLCFAITNIFFRFSNNRNILKLNNTESEFEKLNQINSRNQYRYVALKTKGNYKILPLVFQRHSTQSVIFKVLRLSKAHYMAMQTSTVPPKNVTLSRANLINSKFSSYFQQTQHTHHDKSLQQVITKMLCKCGFLHSYIL